MASSIQNVRSSSWSEISPSADFYYRPSAEIVGGSFRIANILPGKYDDDIHCRIQDVSLKDNSVPFIALSYCWNTLKDHETIWVHGVATKVTANLYAALRNARATNSVVNLWIGMEYIIDTVYYS